MWYYYSDERTFYEAPQEGKECTKAYTDEQYDELHAACDSFHYLADEGDELVVEERSKADGNAEARAKRARICFPIINRGEAWYATLTDEQRAELTEWYRAWLDVTETRVEPETPSWLK